jgi:cyclase
MYEIESLDDVFHVVQNTGGSNIGICVHRGTALVVDAGNLPRVSAQVKKDIEATFGCRVEMVFYTHYHSDHTFGGQSFGCPILASWLCRQTMANCLTSHWSHDEINKAKREEPHLTEEWKDLVITLPTTTFEERWEHDFHGLKILLQRFGGHTPDSSVAYFPDQGVLYAGDIVFGGAYPTLLEHDGNPKELIQVLKTISALNVKNIIPGHGTICGLPFVTTLIEYWEGLLAAAGELARKNDADDVIIEQLMGRCHMPGVPFNEFKHRRNTRLALISARGGLA